MITMVKISAPYSKITSVLGAYNLGMAGGVSFDVIKKANKALRALREGAIETEEVLKIRSKLVRAQIAAAAEETEKAKISDAFNEEVDKANKSDVVVESSEENAKALLEVLSKIEWNNAECKAALKDGKLTTHQMLNVDEFAEGLEESIDEAKAASKKSKE